MHEEWSTRLGSSSWNNRRLVASALVISLAVLTLGIGVAGLLNPSSVAAEATSPPEVAGVVETNPATEVETEIGEAAAARRSGPFDPAQTGHLTVVHLSVSVCGSRSTGSGVVVADGLLVTAAHVVGDATLVRIDQGGITVTGEVLGVLADERDLAVVAVDAPMATPLPTAPVPGVGAPLTLVGYPDGGPRTVAVGGRVEVAPQVAALAGGGQIVGVDVGIEAGISGGPAVDETGTVVGIIVAKEVATDTALVVATPDIASLGSAGLVPGECIGSA